MTRTHLFLLLLAAGCFQAPNEGDAGFVLGGAANVRCRTHSRVGEVCAVVPTFERCAGVQCHAGEECCQTTNRCVAIGDTTSCPRYPTTWQSAPSPRACSARSDCGAEEFCVPDDNSCSGPGHCQSITHCGYCGPPGGEGCEKCGCNGETYPSSQAACIAGVVAAPGSAGCGKTVRGRPDLISCGSDSQCPTDSRCCMRNRVCYPMAEPWRCDPGQDCDDDQECVDRAEGQGGGPGTEFFCKRDSCALQPGNCASAAFITQSCGGEVATVCGCDGMTYVNSCWANAARTNVASVGACP